MSRFPIKRKYFIRFGENCNNILFYYREPQEIPAEAKNSKAWAGSFTSEFRRDYPNIRQKYLYPSKSKTTPLIFRKEYGFHESYEGEKIDLSDKTFHDRLEDNVFVFNPDIEEIVKFSRLFQLEYLHTLILYLKALFEIFYRKTIYVLESRNSPLLGIDKEKKRGKKGSPKFHEFFEIDTFMQELECPVRDSKTTEDYITKLFSRLGDKYNPDSDGKYNHLEVFSKWLKAINETPFEDLIHSKKEKLESDEKLYSEVKKSYNTFQKYGYINADRRISEEEYWEHIHLLITKKLFLPDIFEYDTSILYRIFQGLSDDVEEIDESKIILAKKKAELTVLEIEIKINLRRIIFLEDEWQELNDQFEIFCTSNEEFQEALDEYYKLKNELNQAISYLKSEEPQLYDRFETKYGDSIPREVKEAESGKSLVNRARTFKSDDTDYKLELVNKIRKKIRNQLIPLCHMDHTQGFPMEVRVILQELTKKLITFLDVKNIDDELLFEHEAFEDEIVRIYNEHKIELPKPYIPENIIDTEKEVDAKFLDLTINHFKTLLNKSVKRINLLVEDIKSKKHTMANVQVIIKRLQDQHKKLKWILRDPLFDAAKSKR